MQFRSTTRSHPTSTARPLHGRPRSRSEADPAEAPKSAARLAAEAVFALPAIDPAPSSSAQVVVRKSRALSLVAAPPAPASTAAAAPRAEAPRVFRLDSARSEAVAPAAAASAAAVAGPVRRRRVSADKRPGPLRQLFQAAPAPQPEAEPEDALQAQRLLAELAQLEPVFEAIRRAQSLRLLDTQGARHWQRLAREVDTLQEQIDAQLRG